MKSIYKGGSSVILPKPNDVDYFYYYETKDERINASVNNEDKNIDWHFKLWKNRTKIFLGCYLYPFMKHIDGEVIDEFATFNICDHKDEYVELARFTMQYLPNTSKRWYHILIACYMFENGKNELTKEQLEKAQQVHDNGIADELKAYCKKVLFTN